MIELFLKLLVAHIIGDFVLQKDEWVKDKEEKKIKSWYLYLHLFVHAVALTVCLIPHWNYWPGVLVILMTHYCVDLLKLYLGRKLDSRVLFFLDQCAHLSVITLVVKWYEPFEIEFGEIISPHTLLLLVSLLVCTSVTGVVMKILLSRWQKEIAESEAKASKVGETEPGEGDKDEEPVALESAGLYIGMLERLFVFFFVVSQQYSGIGFLLAAKSVFRFGDLSNAKDRKLTEYILIGTLLSFGIAIATAETFLYLRQRI